MEKQKIPYDNPAVGAFAADLMGEGYPFSPAMTKIVLDGFGWSFKEFQKKFVEWCEKP